MESSQGADNVLPFKGRIYIPDKSVYIGILIASTLPHPLLAKNFVRNGYATIVMEESDLDDMKRALQYLYKENSKLILLVDTDLSHCILPLVSNIDGLDLAIVLGDFNSEGFDTLRRPFLCHVFGSATSETIGKTSIMVHEYGEKDIASLDTDLSFQNPVWNELYTIVQFL